MEDINDNVSDLIIKYLKGQLSKNEMKALDIWLNKNVKNKALFEELINEETLTEKLHRYNSARKDILWNKTLKNIATKEKLTPLVPFKKPIFWYPIGAVASLLIFIISYSSLKTDKPKIQVTEHSSNDAVVGINNATLILADGSTVSLNRDNNGKIAEDAGMKIRKTADGKIVYEVDSKNGFGSKIVKLFSEEERVAKYNQIYTPRGRQYQIILSDGTKVWLNAASSLKYPVEFADNERIVELDGEAYFEVNKQQTSKGKRIPFYVKTFGQTVEVLGTHFNVNSYEDEKSVRTTLLEGSVRVSLNSFGNVVETNKNSSVLLKPNQQSVIQASKIDIIPVDVEEVIAWKKGYYKFNSEELESIMRKISRWYDVEIEFQGNTASAKFGGKISRKESISKVLEIIGETGNVHFEIEDATTMRGKRVIVMPIVNHL